ncbi:hypothetical protein GCM10010170_036970 [Dactylosporangium salmoneum]|uniref:DUF1918 domain-containing protein n=1 Tax=Dactylosporangium salmoneum TaxID=53361 RepID=A0ABN3GCE3_9ACTN
MAEQPVPDVRVHWGQAVHADVVQQAPGPHKGRVDARPHELLSYSGDYLAVDVHEVERGRSRGEPLVQRPDLVVARDPHEKDPAARPGAAGARLVAGDATTP